VDYRKKGSSEVGREIELGSVFTNFPEYFVPLFFIQRDCLITLEMHESNINKKPLV
jgi:hypothetical protein